MQALFSTLRIAPKPKPSQDMMRLDEMLNSRRLEKGWTYEQVHERLERYHWPVGVKPPSLAVVGHWFNGTRRPRKMDHLRGLCDVLDLSIDEAIKGTPGEAKTGLEQRMLDVLRGLSDVDQEMLLAMAARMGKSDARE